MMTLGLQLLLPFTIIGLAVRECPWAAPHSHMLTQRVPLLAAQTAAGAVACSTPGCMPAQTLRPTTIVNCMLPLATRSPAHPRQR